MTVTTLPAQPAARSACQAWCRTRHDRVIVTPEVDYHHNTVGEVPASGMPHDTPGEVEAVSVEVLQHAYNDSHAYVTVFGPGAHHEDDPLRFTAAEAQQFAAILTAAAELAKGRHLAAGPDRAIDQESAR